MTARRPSVDDARRRVESELERIRSRVDRQVGLPLRLGRWAVPIAAALVGVGLALALGGRGALRGRGRTSPDRELPD